MGVVDICQRRFGSPYVNRKTYSGDIGTREVDDRCAPVVDDPITKLETDKVFVKENPEQFSTDLNNLMFTLSVLGY